jgi:hypothetical protein
MGDEPGRVARPVLEVARGPGPGSVAPIRSPSLLRAFQAVTNAYPWQWLPQHLEEWTSDLSTIRGYEHAIRSFCAYLTDGRYGWVDERERHFGSHPIQISFA